MTSEGPRRLHPSAAVVHALGALRELALPLLIGLVVGGSRSPASAIGWGLLGVVVALVLGILRWQGTTYRVDARSLHFRTGLLSPDETVVPLQRIHSVDESQGPIQRLFGVVALHVQTPGGGDDAEVELTAVGRADAVALRTRLGHPPAAAGAIAQRRLGLGALLVAAATAPQLGVLVPVVGAAAAMADDLLPRFGEDLLHDAQQPHEWLVAGAVLLGVALVLSFAGAIIAFSGFEVERDDERLRVRRGLLQRRAASVPVARVDGVQLVEGLLRRPFGLVTVRLEVAGLRGQAVAARTLFPLLRRRDVPAFLERFVPEVAGALEPDRRPPARARRRYLLPPLLVAGAVTAAILVAVPEAWPLALLPLPAALALALADLRAAGARLDGGLLLLRSRRGLARVTLLARRHRLQSLVTSQHPLQRRAGLAHFGVAVGSGAHLRVRHLDAAATAALRDAL